MRGSAWSLGIQLASKSSVLVLTLAVARSLPIAEYGLFFSLLSSALVLATIWDLGFSQMITRDVASGEQSLEDLLQSSLHYRWRSLPIYLACFVICCLMLDVQGSAQWSAAILLGFGAMANGLTMIPTGALQGLLLFRDATVTVASGRLLTSVSCVLILAIGPPLPFVWLAVAFLGGEILVLVLQYHVLGGSALQLYRSLPGRWGRKPGLSIRRALPYAVNSSFSLVYNRMDIFLVALFAGVVESGIYAPASRIQDALMLVPTAATAAVIPIVSKHLSQAESRPDLGRIGLTTICLSVVCSLPVIGGVFIFADPLLPFALGSEYHPAVEPTRTIVWSLLFIAIAQPVFAMVVAMGRVAKLTIAYGAGLATALIGYVVLVPIFGANGAALVAVIRDGIVCGVGLAVALRLWRKGSALGAPGET